MSNSLGKSKCSNLIWKCSTEKVGIMELIQCNSLGTNIRGFPCLWSHILIPSSQTSISWCDAGQKDSAHLFKQPRCYPYKQGNYFLLYQFTSLNWYNSEVGLWSQDQDDHSCLDIYCVQVKNNRLWYLKHQQGKKRCGFWSHNFWSQNFASKLLAFYVSISFCHISDS